MHTAHRGRRQIHTKFLTEHERKMLFYRPGNRWDDNINMDLKETGCEVVDWFHLTQYRIML
jgi:hypothetical protein